MDGNAALATRNSRVLIGQRSRSAGVLDGPVLHEPQCVGAIRQRSAYDEMIIPMNKNAQHHDSIDRPLLSRRGLLSLIAAPAFAKTGPSVAITLDDVAWQGVDGERLLAALGKRQAAVFVAGRNVDSVEGQRILSRWNAAGHLLCNHTYLHQAVDRVGAETFQKDILRNEVVLSRHSNFTKLFRFPVLKEGATAATRDQVRAFLKQHGYHNGAVTIDASDWYFNQRLRERLSADPKFDTARLREPYLVHLWERAQYYDGLSQALLGRSAAHTLLLHYNKINALFLGDVIAMFQKRGWNVIDAAQAFADPVFQREPNNVPAGESLLWALAKESGRFEGKLRYPGEDSVYEKHRLDRLLL